MTLPGQFDTAQFGRITTGDLLRWAAAVIVITTAASAGVSNMQRWTPATATQLAPEPAMLIDLAPLPEPEPTPEPVVEPSPPEPPPEIEQPPVEQPAVAPEPEPIVEPPPPVVEPEIAPSPEPVVESETAPVEEPEPQLQPELEPEPAPLDQTVSDVAMPVMMSPQLRQQRAETPATPRPQRNPTPRKPVVKPPVQQPPRQPQPPATPQAPSQAAAPSISPDQWQSQVLRRMDQRKVYPRAARDRGEAGAVVITFRVDAAGRVTSVSVGRSSGFPTLDQAAIETARRASPLPRPPEGFTGQSLSATIRFTLR